MVVNSVAAGTTHSVKVRAVDFFDRPSSEWVTAPALTVTTWSAPPPPSASQWPDVNGDGLPDEAMPAGSASYSFYEAETGSVTVTQVSWAWEFVPLLGLSFSDGWNLYVGGHYFPDYEETSYTVDTVRPGFEILAEPGYDYTVTWNVVKPDGTTVWAPLFPRTRFEPPEALISAIHDTFPTQSLGTFRVGTFYAFPTTLVRFGQPVGGIQLDLGVLGKLKIDTGGGLRGTISLPGNITIQASAGGARVSFPGGTSVSTSGGTVTVGQTVGGYVITANSNGNITLTSPTTGATIGLGPNGGTLTTAGGIGISVAANGAISLAVPQGSGQRLDRALDVLGKILGSGPVSANAQIQVLPSSAHRVLTTGGWAGPLSVDLGSLPPGDYDVAVRSQDAARDPNLPPLPPQIWVALKVVVPAPKLAVDANRDGTITFDAADATSATAPYRFWLNDDIDRMAHESNPVFTEYEEDDLLVSPTGKVDWEDHVANSRRDLEDFSRLVVSINGLSETFKNGDLYMGLKWADTTGTPAIKLHWQYDPTGSTRYLTNDFQAALQITQNAILNQRYAGEEALTSLHTLVETGEVFVLPQGFWLGLAAGELKRTVLFEGCKAGNGQLKLVILKRDGANYTEIGEGPGVWLDLQKPKEFIERWSAGDGDADTPVLPVVRQSGNSGTFAPPTTDAEKDYVLYVHGYNMQEFEKQRWIETTYKRLYHLSYKGRVAGFTWPCAQSFLPFDDSEVRAWEAGAQLKNLLSALKGGGFRVHILAHSQGNIVVAEALRQWKAAGNTSPLISTYIASQAAIAAHCYDPAAPLIPGFAGSLSDDGTPNVYLNYPPTSAPYLGTAATSGTAARFRNFQNPGDWALTGNSINPLSYDFKPIWQAGQRLKPDFGYGWASTTGFYKAPWIPGVTDYHFPDDRFKIFAYCAEGRSLALGSTETDGVFAGPDTNLSGAFGYGLEHKWHSGQFRSYLAVRYPYWIAVLDAALIAHLNP
jgi:hypothetical protein